MKTQPGDHTQGCRSTGSLITGPHSKLDIPCPFDRFKNANENKKNMM